LLLNGNEYKECFDKLVERRKAEILASADSISVSGSKYYVSADGDDKNDGLTEATAWRTLKRVSEAKELLCGDAVLFRRGELFRGMVRTRPGVTYGAYGEGEKPRLYGWDEDLADASLWTLVDKEHSIWKYTKKILDTGTLVFDGGKAHSIKLIPSYIGGQFVCRDNESRMFDMRVEMVRDLDIYWHFDSILTTAPSRGESFPVPDMTEESYGELYLRCDRGNPGEVFSSIEALPRRAMFRTADDDNVRIDNICMRYIGLHAVAAGGDRVRGLHVTNCEIGWVGGTIQNYTGTDPNYPEGGRGTVTRFGNGVEIYGGCDDYEVSNCYIYEIYDAGATHQVTTFGKKTVMTDIRYKDNLFDKCVYSIEYFLDMNEGDNESYMKGVEISGNVFTDAGYGWGQQRHNKNTPAHIKGWSYVNRASDFTIRDNVIGPSAYRMLHLVARDAESLPEMSANTYIQDTGGMIGQYGANAEFEPEIVIFDEAADEKIERIFKDREAVVYIKY